MKRTELCLTAPRLHLAGYHSGQVDGAYDSYDITGRNTGVIYWVDGCGSRQDVLELGKLGSNIPHRILATS